MELQKILLIYVGGILLLILMSLLVVFNFLRYRFKNDKSTVFIILFFIAFIVTALTTVLMTRTQSSNAPTQQTFVP